MNYQEMTNSWELQPEGLGLYLYVFYEVLMVNIQEDPFMALTGKYFEKNPCEITLECSP